MEEKSYKCFPLLAYSLDEAKEELNVDVKKLISWILDGKVRANVELYGYQCQSLTAVFANKETNLENAYKLFYKGGGEFLAKRSDNRYSNSSHQKELSHIFSTVSSKIVVRSFHLNDDKCSGQLDGYLNGLWQLNCTEELKDFLQYPGMRNELISVVPYITEGLYKNVVAKNDSNYIGGFLINLSYDDLSISKDDMARIWDHLKNKSSLDSLQDIDFKYENINTSKYDRKNLTQQAKQVIGAIIELVDPELNETPSTASEKIEKMLARKGLPGLSIGENYIEEAIKYYKKDSLSLKK